MLRAGNTEGRVPVDSGVDRLGLGGREGCAAARPERVLSIRMRGGLRRCNRPLGGRRLPDGRLGGGGERPLDGRLVSGGRLLGDRLVLIDERPLEGLLLRGGRLRPERRLLRDWRLLGGGE